MAAATVTGQVSLLKRFWGNKVAQPMYDKSRLLDLAKKDTKFLGESKYIAVNIAPTSGGSSNFEDAVASQDPSSTKRFEIRRKREYQVCTIANELIEAGSGQGAIVDALKFELDKARQSFGEAMARRAWGDGGGSLGQLDSGVNLASTTLTLRSRTNIVGVFNIGTQLEFATDNGTASNPAGRLPTATAPDRLKVVSVDRTNGAVTTNAALNTIGGLTANGYVFRRGDYANAITGLPGWLPIVAPTTGDNFFTVDRTADIIRLSGYRVPSSGSTKEETLQNAGAEASINNAQPKHLFVNPLDYKDLCKELGSKVNIGSDGKASVGFSNVRVFLATGEVEIISEPFVPKGYAWLGDAGDVTLASAGDCPMMLTKGQGTNNLLLLPGNDAFQGRLGTYAQISIDNPGNWGVITW